MKTSIANSEKFVRSTPNLTIILRPHRGNLIRRATGVVTTLLAVGPYLLKDREVSLRDRIGG